MIAPRVFLLTLALAAGTARAGTPATARIVRNVTTALDNVKVDDALVRGPIAEASRQTATNLLRDLDYALGRAGSELGRVSPEDQGDAQVQALLRRVGELKAQRDQLASHLAASVESGKELDGQYRAFRDDARPYGKALALFPEASGSSQRALNVTAEHLVAGLERLAELDQICRSKYAKISFNDRLAFQLAIDPIKVCDTAARRQALATAAVVTMVQTELARWVAMIDEVRTKLGPNQGFVPDAGGVVGDLIHARTQGKAAFVARQKPLFDAIGATLPADLTAPFDTAVDALWAEIDRLAPTFRWPDKRFKDRALEAGATKALAGFKRGAKIVKTGMLFADWDVAKNNLDIPTEKYRTGAILFKTAESRWCQYKEFTAHLEYTGGGTYQRKPTYTFNATRYQQCQ